MLINQGRTGEAIQHLQETIRLQPQHQAAREVLRGREVTNQPHCIAVLGSVRLARKAGTTHAAMATTPSTSDDIVRTPGSPGCTP